MNQTKKLHLSCGLIFYPGTTLLNQQAKVYIFISTFLLETSCCSTCALCVVSSWLVLTTPSYVCGKIEPETEQKKRVSLLYISLFFFSFSKPIILKRTPVCVQNKEDGQ